MALDKGEIFACMLALAAPGQVVPSIFQLALAKARPKAEILLLRQDSQITKKVVRCQFIAVGAKLGPAAVYRSARPTAVLLARVVLCLYAPARHRQARAAPCLSAVAHHRAAKAAPYL